MTTPASRIDTLINKEKERVEVLTVRALSYLGELCVIEARNRPQEISWYDRSGNLRSSIGYAIIHNGKILEYSDFTQVRQGNEGVRKGKALIEELSKKFANGYALVVVAGMNLMLLSKKNLWKQWKIRMYLHPPNCLQERNYRE